MARNVRSNNKNNAKTDAALLLSEIEGYDQKMLLDQIPTLFCS